MSKFKPYKMKPSDGNILSRDDVSAWDYNHQAYCRQIADWTQWLPNGTRSEWIPSDQDETNGLQPIMKVNNRDEVDEDLTNKNRASLRNFLTCLAVNCPSGFMETVMRESTSYTWVVNKIKETFRLNTRGENFLEGSNIRFEFGPDFTYQQAWMKIKDFYTSSLLPAGSTFMGRNLDTKETLSPLAYMFLVKEWLQKIHPGLPDYVLKNESHLFTVDKPTLACNQQLLCDKMDSMLQKLEQSTDGDMSTHVTIQNVVSKHRRPGPLNRNQFTTARYPQAPNRKRCYICIEAGRTGVAGSHIARDCRWRFQVSDNHQQQPRQPKNNKNFKVLLVQNLNSDVEEQLGNLSLNASQDSQFDEVIDHYRGDQEHLCDDESYIDEL